MLKAESMKDKLVMKFAVLWEGWELDGEAAIFKRGDGSVYLRMTDHGAEYTAENGELHKRLKAYRKVLVNTEKALEILEEKVI